VFAITSKENLGDAQVVYPGQIVSKNASTTNLFVLWNNYPKALATGTFDGVYSQSLIGESNP